MGFQACATLGTTSYSLVLDQFDCEVMPACIGPDTQPQHHNLISCIPLTRSVSNWTGLLVATSMLSPSGIQQGRVWPADHCGRDLHIVCHTCSQRPAGDNRLEMICYFACRTHDRKTDGSSSPAACGRTGLHVCTVCTVLLHVLDGCCCWCVRAAWLCRSGLLSRRASCSSTKLTRS